MVYSRKDFYGVAMLIEPSYAMKMDAKLASLEGVKLKADTLKYLSKKFKIDQQPYCIEDPILLAESTRRIPYTSNNKKGSVGVVPLKGPITLEDGWCHDGIGTFISNMNKMTADAKISSIVIDADTGGGEVVASELGGQAVSRALKSKPVVTHVKEVVASGGYWITAPTEIYMSGAMASVGSIGVVMSQYKRDIDYQNEKMVFIYSNYSERKHELRKQICEGDFEKVKIEFLDPIALEFHKRVKASRGSKLDLKKENVLEGAMYNSRDAIQFGLAEKIGTFNDAVRRSISLANVRQRKKIIKALQ